MNYLRAIKTGVMLWLTIFVVITILMFLPFLVDKKMLQFGIFWILLIPIVLLFCKWHFKMDAPNLKKGFLLGIIMLLVILVLDMVITVPLFVKSFSVFFGDWMMFVGYIEVLLLAVYAGFEFDKTFTKYDNTK